MCLLELNPDDHGKLREEEYRLRLKSGCHLPPAKQEQLLDVPHRDQESPNFSAHDYDRNTVDTSNESSWLVLQTIRAILYEPRYFNRLISENDIKLHKMRFFDRLVGGL